MQLIVLGMHRSGTSMVTRLINMMGAYFGAEEASTGANKENPKGFWERRDIRDLNDELLFSVGADWHRVLKFESDCVPVEARRQFQERARRVVLGMDAHRPWVAKEPRFCLTLPLWHEILECPLGVVVVRDPTEIALSLRTRNELPLQVGVALWEAYTQALLCNTRGMPIILVRHSDLFRDPVDAAERLFEALQGQGVRRLSLPSQREIKAFIDPNLYRQQRDGALAKQLLTAYQQNLASQIGNEDWDAIDTPEALSTSAYETLVAHEQVYESTRQQDELAKSEAVAIEKATLLQKTVTKKQQETNNQRNEVEKKAKDEATLREEVVRLRSELQETSKALTARGKAVEKLEVALMEKEREESVAREEAGGLRGELEVKSKLLAGRERAIAELEAALMEKERADSVVREEASSLRREFEKKLKKAEYYQALLEKKLASSMSVMQYQNNLFTRLENEVSALLTSWRWKTGNIAIRQVERILLRKKSPIAADRIRDLFAEYRSQDNGRDGEQNFSSNVIRDVKHSASLFSGWSISVDIVVCIHNALEDVKACLSSIDSNTEHAYTLILVNDGSDEATTTFLTDYCEQHASVKLLRNQMAQGYTKAANAGLKESTADYVLLLNSDTVVSPLWLESILECGESNPGTGIIGPLSNAASWQSIPRRFDSGGDWAVNELPAGYDVSQVAELTQIFSEKRFPEVAFINGFCFAIKRKVIDKIGYLDEENFPRGYGEENDYCLRAAAAGFQLRIADHAYVFHAKSKSFTHNKRRELSTHGGNSLKKKHGANCTKMGVKRLKENVILAEMRRKMQEYFSNNYSSRKSDNSLSILFILPVQGGGGGAHSVIQEVAAMRALGVNAKVANLKRYEPAFIEKYGFYHSAGEYFIFYEGNQDLINLAAHYDVIIATIYHSVSILPSIVKNNPNVLPGYYIQDYEPWFFEEGSIDWQIAYGSYGLIPGMLLFAKTDWLCQMVGDLQGLSVKKVSPSIDTDVFFSDKAVLNASYPVTVCAMIRPSTPRRAPAITFSILRELKHQYANNIKVVLFGCSDSELKGLDVCIDFEFQNYGVLQREQVADLHRASDVFVDFSDYQAFGRTGLEAMACGCTAILPNEGGVHEYARDEENALIVDTTSVNDMTAALRRLIEDHSFRLKLQTKAIETAGGYSAANACLSELSVFRNAWYQWNIGKNCKSLRDTGSSEDPGKVRVSVLAVQTYPTPAGSTYIRLLRPLQHPSVASGLSLRICDVSSLREKESDLVIVQRNAVKSEKQVAYVQQYCGVQKCPLCLEVDDDLLNLHNKTGQNELPEAELVSLRLIAKAADLVITSSDLLRATFSDLNNNTICIPNAVDENLWLQTDDNKSFMRPIKESEDVVRFVYMGTFTHTHDLLLLDKAWEKIKFEYGDRVTLDIIGGVDPEVDLSSFMARTSKKKLKKGMEYPAFVHWLKKHNQWDVGLIPLQINDFNRRKSYIKYLDYTALGIPSICTAIEPYKEVVKDGVNGLLVENDTESWYQAIKKMIDEPEFREKIAASAFDELVSKHILRTRSQEFWMCYSQLVTR